MVFIWAWTPTQWENNIQLPQPLRRNILPGSKSKLTLSTFISSKAMFHKNCYLESNFQNAYTLEHSRYERSFGDMENKSRLFVSLKLSKKENIFIFYSRFLKENFYCWWTNNLKKKKLSVFDLRNFVRSYYNDLRR